MPARSKIAKKTVSVELQFVGQDRIVQPRTNVFLGGVVAPDVSASLGFEVLPEVLNEDGVLSPTEDAVTVDGTFQINIVGTAAGYRELARYLLGVAELDTTVDPDFHEHHQVSSRDNRTHLHLIVRKFIG